MPVTSSQYPLLVWDYNLPLSEFNQILLGKSTKGWFTQEWAIARVLENLNYYDVLSLVPTETLRSKWADVKPKLFKSSIIKGYEFLLHRYSLSSPRQGSYGTALSRGYLNHRHSDDLDFFINQDQDFFNTASNTLKSLSTIPFDIKTKTDTFFSIIVNQILKVDFVNDSGKHYESTIKHPLFPRLDNINNILVNKITAIIGRDEPKDVVDIWAISNHTKINWPEIFTASDSKAVGIMPTDIAQKISTFPLELLKEIKWTDTPPSPKEFKIDLEKIIDNILLLPTK